MIRIGKLGIERRTGKDYTALRQECLDRDLGRCVKCNIAVDDSLPMEHPRKFDMSHIRSHGAGGSDVLSNVETTCHNCHMTFHGCH